MTENKVDSQQDLPAKGLQVHPHVFFAGVFSLQSSTHHQTEPQACKVRSGTDVMKLVRFALVHQTGTGSSSHTLRSQKIASNMVLIASKMASKISKRCSPRPSASLMASLARLAGFHTFRQYSLILHVELEHAELMRL